MYIIWIIVFFDKIYNNTLLEGLRYNNKEYYYVRDITGCIEKIIDNNKKDMVLYKYTSYGQVEAYINPSLSTSEQTIANILMNNNGFVYKGYYYDVETSLFWISSRYYSPELCRWISPDDIEYLDPESVNGLNLYCYCFNNPISYYDPSGHSVLLTILLIAFIVDTIVETSILMCSDNYKAEKVYKLDPKTGEENVNIPNSALFNNPIAQTIYANYLYKNVKRADGSNYFNGSVYDIIGEWQAHNDASKLLGLSLFMPGAIIQNIPTISSGVQTAKG